MTTAQSGRLRFSEDQRALFTACEFWAAYQNASLPEYFSGSGDIESSLSAAEAAFNTVGLTTVAVALTAARQRYTVKSPPSTQRLIHHVEAALSDISEPVDVVLENFARRIKQVEEDGSV